MKSSLRIVPVIVWMLSPSCSERAKAQAPPDSHVYFSALDRSEKPVLGLSAADFELRVDGHPAALESFRVALPYTDRSIPLAAWVIIDFNPNINSKLIEAQANAARSILDLFHPASVIGVKLVSDRLETLTPLAHDATALRNAFFRFSGNRNELKVDGQKGTVVVGRGGIVSAIGRSIDELAAFRFPDPALQDRETHRAIMILSDGNIDPAAKRAPIYAKAAESRVFLYPVFVPRPSYGSWLQDYFDLARRTAGVASVFGALSPGSDIVELKKQNTAPNALTFNFIHMARDLNGKYSFATPGNGNRARISLKCRMKYVRIRLPG